MNEPAYINDPDAIVSAAWDGDYELVIALIKKGVNINVRNEYGETALIAACDQGYYGVVKLLLESGADVNEKNHDGDNALDIANFQHHGDIEQLIVSFGAKRNNVPSEKEKLWDQVNNGFDSVNAVKKLIEDINRNKK